MTGILSLVLGLSIARVAGQCNFPSTFTGTWVSSSDGTWIVNGSHILDFKVTGISGYTKLSFFCYQVQGSLYALQSTHAVELFTGVFKNLYTCLDIRFSTTVKYVYYKNTDTGSPTASEVTTQTDFSKICNKVNHDQPYSHHIALMSGNETSALTNCPATLFGSFRYDTCIDPGSTNTSMNACDTRQQLVYDYALCNTKQMFSAEGVLDCVYFVQSGTVTYLTVYNRDTTPSDNINYYRFSCLAIEEQPDSTRKITASPEQCEVNQSPSTITSPGQAIQFTPYYLCQITTSITTTTSTTTNTVTNATIVTISSDEAIVHVTTTPSDSSTDIGLIIGIIAAIIIFLIIVAIIILCCCLRKRRQRKKVDDEERAIADDTDDQRSEGRRDSNRRDSGSSSGDEDKRSIDSGIGREPPSGRGRGHLDDQEQEAETIKIVGEVDVDDKTARPRSEQAEETSKNQNDGIIEQTEDKTNENNEAETNVDEDNNNAAVTEHKHINEDTQLDEENSNAAVTELKHINEGTHLDKDNNNAAVTEHKHINEDTHLDEDNNNAAVTEHKHINQDTHLDEDNNNATVTEHKHINEDTHLDKDNNNAAKTEQKHINEDTHLDEDNNNATVTEHKHIDEDTHLDEDNNNTAVTEHKHIIEDTHLDKDNNNAAVREHKHINKDTHLDEDNNNAAVTEHKHINEDTHLDEDNNNAAVKEHKHINEDTHLDEDNNNAAITEQINEGTPLEDQGKVNVIRKENEPGLKGYDVIHGDKEEISNREDNMERQCDEDEVKDKLQGDTVQEMLNEENDDVSADKENENTDRSRMTQNEDHVDSRHVVIKDERREQEEGGTRHREEDVVDSKTAENNDEEDVDNTEKMSTGEQRSDEVQPLHSKKKHRERRVIGLTSDGEEIYATKSDESDGDDRSIVDAEIERRKIGQKKHKVFTPAAPLTTILVTRQDEERRRNKLMSKSKRQKMQRLAKKKTKTHDSEGNKDKPESDISSSDEGEEKRYGTDEAPYIEQYRYKKKMENKLNEEHYWSEPGDDMYGLNRTEDSGSSILSSTASSIESDVDSRNSPVDYLVDKDGNIITRSKQTLDKRDTDNNTNRKTVEPDTKDHDDEDEVNESDKKRSKESDANVTGSLVPEAGHKQQTQKTQDSKITNGGARLIQVKEHEDKRDHLQSAENRKVTKNKTKGGKSGDSYQIDNAKMDTFNKRLNKNSDADSGVEDEEILDVVLTEEQQQLIVNVLFDKDINLRPEFDRDANGRIVRKLDNTVIYDPHTGRFTFRRRQETLFKLPRLKRNKKGRPTGGYIEDEYGPKTTERQKSSLSRSSRRGADSRMSRMSDSQIYDKRSRGEGRNVGFRDVDAVSVRDLEFHKRGRRDVGSGIRRKLKNRLFRKTRKRTDPSSAGSARSSQPRTAWTKDTLTQYTESDSELNPILHRGGMREYSTPTSQRRNDHDSQQWQRYRQGLETDRRILSGLQYTRASDRKSEQRSMGGSYSDLDGESSIDYNVIHSETEEMHTDSEQELRREPTYWTEDGRFVVRERGCPEIQPVPLFKILRRPGTMADYEKRLDDFDESRRRFDTAVSSGHHAAPKSAPVQMQTHEDQNNREQETGDGVNENMNGRDSGGSQVKYIDDYRLRQLLEELYRDKKYFDQYVEATEPESEVVIHTKGLAEHGRGYLLERAGYWEKRGPLPPRPPQTEIGWKMQRQQIVMESARTSEHDSTRTVTPDMRPYTVPGYVDVKTPGETDNKENEAFV